MKWESSLHSGLRWELHNVYYGSERPSCYMQQIFSSPLSIFPSVSVKNRIFCFIRAIMCLLGGFYSLFWRYTRLETNLQMNVTCCCYSWCGNVNDQELVNLIIHYGKIKSYTHAQTLQLTEIPWHLRTEDIHHSLLPSFLPRSSFPLLYLKLHGEDTNKTESILSGQLSPCTSTMEPAPQGLRLTITGPTCCSDWQVHLPQSRCTAREASAVGSPWTTTRESSCSKEDPVTAKNKQYSKNLKSKEDTVLPKKKKNRKHSFFLSKSKLHQVHSQKDFLTRKPLMKLSETTGLLCSAPPTPYYIPKSQK